MAKDRPGKREQYGIACSYLQSNGVLLHLLRALPFVGVWRGHAQVEGQLGPCLDLFGVEFANELKQVPGVE